MGDAFEYIDAGELSASLLAGDVASLVVVDVRDDDFAGGHVRGAINIPSTSSLWQPEQKAELLARINSSRSDSSVPVQRVVFHCAKSQVRGPSCARLFASALEEAASTTTTEAASTTSEAAAAPPKVLVLRAGYNNWESAYKGSANEEALIER